VHSERRVGDLELLVDGYVERNAIVVETPAAVKGRSVGFVECVRESDAGLEGPLERFAIVAGGDIAIDVEGNDQVVRIASQRVSAIRIGDMIRVQHVGLVIPPNAEIESQALDRTPIILEVGAELLVARLEERIPSSVPEIEGRPVVVNLISITCIANVLVLKGWSGVVSLVDVVLGKSDTNSTLDHMFASELEPGVGKIITESWPLLDEFLVRDTTADLEAAAGWEDESPVRRTRLVGAESTVKMSVADERFIEPWAREEVVLQ